MHHNYETQKKRSPKEPRWIGPVTLLCTILVYMVLGVILTLLLYHELTVPSLLGAKGIGLFFLLLLYIPTRRIILGIYYKRTKIKGAKTDD